jgi:spermidine synthase
MSFWFDETFENVCRFGVSTHKTLFSEHSEFQLIEVLETNGFGRVLAIDKMFMTSERDEYLYHEMIVHPALTLAKQIKRVLVIGGGDGGTVREVLSYPEVEEVVMVEIDGVVVEASKAFLGTIGTAWNDKRLDVRVGDGLDFVEDNSLELFDVILLDHSDPVGPAKGLFDERFYLNCKNRLSENGVFCLQSESPLLQRKTFVEIVHTLGNVFGTVHPYFGTVPLYATGAWSWTLAARRLDPFALNEQRVELQEKRCRYYNRDIHRAAFTVPNELRPLIGLCGH